MSRLTSILTIFNSYNWSLTGSPHALKIRRDWVWLALQFAARAIKSGLALAYILFANSFSMQVSCIMMSVEL